MTDDEIRELAKKAGFSWGFIKQEGLRDGMIDFATLVAQQERNACADLCEKFAGDMTVLAEWGASQCANAIRARAQA